MYIISCCAVIFFFSEDLEEDNAPSIHHPPPGCCSSFHLLPQALLCLYRFHIRKYVWLIYSWSQANLICLIGEWLHDAHTVKDKDKRRRSRRREARWRDYISWVKFCIGRQGWEQVIIRNGLIWSHVWLSLGHECFNTVLRVNFRSWLLHIVGIPWNIKCILIQSPIHLLAAWI